MPAFVQFRVRELKRDFQSPLPGITIDSSNFMEALAKYIVLTRAFDRSAPPHPLRAVTCLGSIEARREVAAARLVILADGHQGKRLFNAQAFIQAPPKEGRLSNRQMKREGFPHSRRDPQ